jgi:hypothetical protein
MGKLKDLLLEKSETMPPYNIYCDMDGVLTDFETRFEHYTGYSNPKEYEDEFGSAAFWNIIDGEVGIKFWSEMPWMP